MYSHKEVRMDKPTDDYETKFLQDFAEASQKKRRRKEKQSTRDSSFKASSLPISVALVGSIFVR